MAYFPHAYQKMLVATAASNPILSGNGTLKSIDLTAGQVSLVDAKTNVLLDLTATPTYAATPLVYLAQGSFAASDKLGPFHGGYKESVKSKGINPKYVSAFYRVDPAAATQNIVDVTALGCALPCNTTYRLRIDIKGSPALRFLTHNAYKTLDAFTGCCDVAGVSNNVDPNVVLLQWKDQINTSPIIQQFVQAKVWNSNGTTTTTASSSASTTLALTARTNFPVGAKITGTGIPNNTYIVASGSGAGNVTLSKAATVANGATVKAYVEIATGTYTPVTGGSIASVDSLLELTGAYVDTKFGDCSFSPKDHVELQPIQIYTSVVDQSGNPCATTCFTQVEIQGAYQGKGYGETLVRELILDKRYRQEPWVQDPRTREVLGDTSLSEISRTKVDYTVYHILHSVPRKSNPSGVMDNDQYLIKVVTTGANANFETFFNTLLTSAGNSVQLEVKI